MAPKGRVGIVSVIVQNAKNVGAAVLNQFITLYTNPNFLDSDWKVGPDMFFSQAVIIERVPSVYVYLVIISSVLQFAGICFMWKYCSNVNNLSHVNLDMQMDIPASQSKKSPSLSLPSFDQESNTEKYPILSSDEKDEKQSKSIFAKIPTQCIKYCFRQRKFYTIVLSSVVNGISWSIIPSYYKEIGR